MSLTPIRKIVLVGAGTSGWLTASAIKKNNPDIDVTIIHDSSIPTMGVGETLTFQMPHFMKNILGLNDDEWMVRCHATYKLGVRWVNWKNKGDRHQSAFIDEFPAHEILANTFITNRPINNTLGKNLPNLQHPELAVSDLWYSMYHAGMLGNNAEEIQASLSDNYYFALNEKSTRTVDGAWLTHNVNGFSYHYNAEVVSNVVGDLVGRPCGVNEIDSRVVHIAMNNGTIDHLVLANGEHITADLFIDCSGFKRLLISQMPNEWLANDEFCNNSALVKQVQYDGVDNPHHRIGNSTTFSAMNSGWRFGLPLQNRSGNGYIFNKNITPDIDQLVDEFNQALDDTKDCRLIQWSPGRWQNAVSNNCLSVGLSLGFSDPFDANNLMLTINLIEILLNLLKDEKTNNLYMISRILNKKADVFWKDTDMRIKSALRLSPKNDTKYYQVISQAAKDANLHEEFLAHIERTRQEAAGEKKFIGSMVSRDYLWNAWSYTTLATRYGIKLPTHEFDPGLAEVAKHYFTTRMAKNKLLADRAPHIREFYREYFKLPV